VGTGVVAPVVGGVVRIATGIFQLIPGTSTGGKIMSKSQDAAEAGGKLMAGEESKTAVVRDAVTIGTSVAGAVGEAGKLGAEQGVKAAGSVMEASERAEKIEKLTAVPEFTNKSIDAHETFGSGGENKAGEGGVETSKVVEASERVEKAEGLAGATATLLKVSGPVVARNFEAAKAIGEKLPVGTGEFLGKVSDYTGAVSDIAKGTGMIHRGLYENQKIIGNIKSEQQERYATLDRNEQLLDQGAMATRNRYKSYSCASDPDCDRVRRYTLGLPPASQATALP
jgi:hypothetical protein